MKFTFKCVTGYTGQPKTVTTNETDAVSLPDIIDSFELFLRGCGYAVEIGQLELGETGE